MVKIKNEKLIEILKTVRIEDLCFWFGCDSDCSKCPVNSEYDYQKTLKRILKDDKKRI